MTSTTGIAITSLEVNVTAVAPVKFTIDVYTCPTTYVGNDTNASAWTLVSNGKALGAGVNNPSVVTFAPPIQLATGSYGMALYYNGASPRYTDGTGGNQNYSNADLGIATGIARTALFGGSLFSPRVWNGTIVYGTSATPPSFVTWGSSSTCVGSNGTPKLAAAANSAPKLGTTFQLDLSNLPLVAGTVTLIGGVSRDSYSSLSLPFDLGAINMVGCYLHTSIDLTVNGVNQGTGNGLAFLGIPNSAALLGGEIFLQAFVPDAAASGLQARVTNAGQAVLGN